MRFDDYLEGFDSLWESEKQNISLDEKREAIRNERSTHNFMDLLRDSSNQTDKAGLFLAGEVRIHAKTFGQNWVAGTTCPSGEIVVVPLVAVKAVLQAKACDCAIGQVANHPLVPFGALLRRYERSGFTLNLRFAGNTFSGRVISVFRDAVTFATADSQLLIAFAAIESISVPWA